MNLSQIIYLQYSSFNRKVESIMYYIRNDILKALEEARQDKVIGKSLEAHVLVHVSDEDKELLKRTFIKFNCQNFSFFWIQLWNIGKKINTIKNIGRRFDY